MNVDDVNGVKVVRIDCCCTAWRSGCASCSPTSESASSFSSSAGTYILDEFFHIDYKKQLNINILAQVFSVRVAD
jgi:hypothetical protein